MALKLNEKYPQRWESPSNDYPQGAFKNLSAIGEQDGSYLEKDWLNDYSGFFGALLRNAQMTPNGLVDTAQQSQFYDALVQVAKNIAVDNKPDLSEYFKKEDIAQEWGDSPDKVLSQEFLSGYFGDDDGSFIIKDGAKTFTFPKSREGVYQVATTEDLDFPDLLFKTPSLRSVNVELKKSFIPMAYVPRGDGSVLLMVREGDSHYPHPDAQIVTYVSNDGLTSLERREVFYNEDGIDILNSTFGSINDSHFVFALPTNDGNYQDPFIWKTKDGGVSWDKIELNKSSELQTGFSSLPCGGIYYLENLNIHAVFFYSNNKIAVSYSEDEGESWSDITLIIQSNASNPISEMALFQSKAGLVLLMRSGDNAVAKIATSADLLNWSTLQDSKLELGASPLFSKELHGRQYLIAVDRNNHLAHDARNVVVTYHIDPEKLYENPSTYSFDNPQVVAQLPHWGVGTIKKVVDIVGKPTILINAWEHTGNRVGSSQWSQGGALNSLFVLSDIVGTEAPAIMSNIRKRNHLTNGSFKVRNFGNSGGIGTSRRETTATCWGVRFTGGAGDGYWELNDDGLVLNRTIGNSSTNHINLINVMNTEELRSLRGKWVNFCVDIHSEKITDNDIVCYLYGTETPISSIGTDGSFSGNEFVVSQPIFRSGLHRFNALIPKNWVNLAVRIIIRPKETSSTLEHEVLIKKVQIFEGAGNCEEMTKSIAEAELECSRYFQSSIYDMSNVDSRGSVAGFNVVEYSRSITQSVTFSKMARIPKVKIYSKDMDEGYVTVIPDGLCGANTELVSRSGFHLYNTEVIPAQRVYRFHWVADAQYW